MRSSSQTSSGMAITTIQAPSVNLPTTITTRATMVTAAPTPLIRTPPRQPGSRRRRCRRVMPAWARVKEVTTPTAYSGIRAWVSAWKATIRKMATADRAMMPLE